jgi:hypothetical protein
MGSIMGHDHDGGWLTTYCPGSLNVELLEEDLEPEEQLQQQSLGQCLRPLPGMQQQQQQLYGSPLGPLLGGEPKPARSSASRIPKAEPAGARSGGGGLLTRESKMSCALGVVGF